MLGFSVIAGLFFISRQNYLLFHALVELGAVAVAWSVFLITWNARRLKIPPGFMLLGVGYMLVGGLDLLHTLAYEGMGVFPGSSTDLATRLWIAARGIETTTLIGFPLCFFAPGLARVGAVALITATLVMLGSIFIWDIFPECFNARSGLTPFKSVSEYIVMGILGMAAILTWRQRDLIDKHIASLLTGAMLVTIVSEFSFTLYASPVGLANVTGHLLKAASFILIYQALIVESLERPLDTLAHGLRAEADRYARIIETATDGFWLVDMQGRICDANESAARMTGFSRSDMVAMHVSDIDARESMQETTRRIHMMAEHKYELFETRHKHKNGSLLDVEVSCSYLPYDGGRIVAFVRDISKRKLAARTIEASEARYRGIVSALPDLLFCIDADLQFTDVQTSVPEMLLAPAEQIIGHTVWERLPPDIAALTAQKIRATLENDHMQVYHYALAVNGDIREFESRMVPYGKHKVLAVVRDITEQKRTEAALAAKHATLQAIFNASPDILILKDNDLIYRQVNPAFSAFVGKPSRQIVGRTDYDLFPEADASKYVAGDAAVIQTGVREDKEWQVMGHGGRQWLQVIKTAVRTPDGRSSGVLCTGRDVSEYHRLENLLLAASQQEQEKFAQELHDGLCQDLKSLEIEATLLENKVSAGKADIGLRAASIAEKANLAVKKVYSIVAGTLPIGLDAESFSTALSELAGSIQNQANDVVVTSIQANLKPNDDNQAYHLYRIAQESLKNARRHSKASRIDLDWRLEDGMKLLSIRDNGIGIGKKNRVPSNGMGLQVMHSRAQAIDACLTVQNLENGGAEILVRLKDE